MKVVKIMDNWTDDNCDKTVNCVDVDSDTDDDKDEDVDNDNDDIYNEDSEDLDNDTDDYPMTMSMKVVKTCTIKRY